MRTSEQIDKLSLALVEAQKQMKALEKNGVNNFFKKPDGKASEYATMDDVVEACKEALTNSGLFFLQGASFKEGLWQIETRLQHSSGQWIESDYPLASKDGSPQGLAAGMTYAKRISLQAMVGLSGEPDDDGNAASGKTVPSKQVAQVKAAPVNVTPKPSITPRQTVTPPKMQEPDLTFDDINF